jgi:hypothetical protein
MDWDLRGRDVDQRFAGFGSRPMTDEDVWALSLASMVMPTGHPGCWGYLAKVSQSYDAQACLAEWGGRVAAGIATGRYRPRGRQYRRAYVESYSPAWGRYAVADGLSLAVNGTAPGIEDRCTTLKIGKQGYQRIRDFVGGLAVEAIAEYRHALCWALGYMRDRIFEARWESVTGQNWDAVLGDATIAREGSIPKGLAQGCRRIGSEHDSDERFAPWKERPFSPPRHDPETLYPAIQSTEWFAPKTPASPVIVYKPRPGTNGHASDG